MSTVRMTIRLPQELADLLDQLPNRSDFVRGALLERLGSLCPHCGGSGVLAQPADTAAPAGGR